MLDVDSQPPCRQCGGALELVEVRQIPTWAAVLGIVLTVLGAVALIDRFGASGALPDGSLGYRAGYVVGFLILPVGGILILALVRHTVTMLRCMRCGAFRRTVLPPTPPPES